jgi:hypothetical protein
VHIILTASLTMQNKDAGYVENQQQNIAASICFQDLQLELM